VLIASSTGFADLNLEPIPLSLNQGKQPAKACLKPEIVTSAQGQNLSNGGAAKNVYSGLDSGPNRAKSDFGKIRIRH
jgi:hypothetical protein